jgi:chemotaxis protein methyltransferase CheR
MASSLVTQQLNNEQQARFTKLIYDRTGIAIPAQKTMLLSSRLKRRMRELDKQCFDQYFNYLSKLARDDQEWDAFVQEITTHETYLFRDPSHWKWFQEVYLPEIERLHKAQISKRSLRIWSAACSTGDEAYTIASCIAKKLGGYKSLQVEILGTDIGIGALAQAQAGCFSERAMRLVPSDMRRNYFNAQADGGCKTNESISRYVQFKNHNLIEPLKGKPFDLIFVKNVLIYFDDESKKKVLSHIDRALSPNGLLVTGPAEGVTGMLKDYTRLHPWLHQKQ